MMAKKIFKKSILKLKENAANMPNAEFKKEGSAILSSIEYMFVFDGNKEECIDNEE